jgi:hypothetical protein
VTAHTLEIGSISLRRRVMMPERLRRMRMAVVAALVPALVADRPGAAQAPPSRAQGDSTPAKSHVFPAVGIRAGTPQKVSVALGVVTGVDWQSRGAEHSRNIAFFVEPGLGATRASIAYITGVGNMGSGFGLAATGLRTSSSPWTLARNTNYVGGELIIWPIFFTGVRIAVFRRVSGQATMGRWFLGGDLGVGL